MSSRALLIEVHLLDGRYHGASDWPPAPFRLFQALVAGGYGGRWRSEPKEQKDAAFRWLEMLDPPLILAPPKVDQRVTTYYVPNNDIDAVGGDPRRVAEIRTPKIIRPVLFDAEKPLVYAWRFEEGEEHADRLCRIAERLHTLGRGIDAAFALGEVCDWERVEARLSDRGNTIARPSRRGNPKEDPWCPTAGSLDSLKRRQDASEMRFRERLEGRGSILEFRQPPKSQFRAIAYDRPPTRIVFDLRSSENPEAFRGVAQERAVDVAKAARDLVAHRLKEELPQRAAEIDRIIVGRDSGPADIGRRIRFIPLTSIGMTLTDPSIRRVLVEIPPECPFTRDELSWSLSGQNWIDPNTGEIVDDRIYVAAEDDGILRHFGIGQAGRRARRWQTVTPVALPQGRSRGRLRGVDRAEDVHQAAAAVAEALRHAGHDWRDVDIRVQTEPFHRKGARSDAFRADRFVGRLRHVEIAFDKAIAGPLIIGDGRWLGLGIMAPAREEAPGLHLFSIEPASRPPASAAEEVAKALRRAVMARTEAQRRRERTRPLSDEQLPTFFTGHIPNAGPEPARSGHHEHLFFVAEDADHDGRLDRLAVISPHLVDRSIATDSAKRREIAGYLRLLDRGLADLTVLRAGRAGLLRLSPAAEPGEEDPLFGRSRTWASQTPYRPTRHPHRTAVEEAVRLDLLEECNRRGLPRPEADVLGVQVGPRGGLAVRARLRFNTAVSGPLLLGRNSHFGAGMFVL